MSVPQAASLAVASSEPSFGTPSEAVAVSEATNAQQAIGVLLQPPQGRKWPCVAMPDEAMTAPLGRAVQRGAAGADPLPVPQASSLVVADSEPSLGTPNGTVAVPGATDA